MNRFSHAWCQLALLMLASGLLTACSAPALRSSLPEAEAQFAQRYSEQQLRLNASETLSLHQTLTLQHSLRLMLQHSPKVRASLAELGIADAAVMQAELINNPHLGFAALKPEDGGRWQLETGISQPLLSWLTRPLQRQLAQEQLLAAQLRLQVALQREIAVTSRAYIAAVAAEQNRGIQVRMLDASRAQYALASSLHQAGNLSEKGLLHYDKAMRLAELAVLQASQTAAAKLIDLKQQIGVASSAMMHLPMELPPPVPESFQHRELYEQALGHRLDIQLLQQEQRQLQQRQKLLRQEYGWRDISLGVTAEREFDGAVNLGPEVEMALPIFNRGQGKLAQVDAQLARLGAQQDQARLAADSEIAQALSQLTSAQQSLALLSATLPIVEKRLQLSLREVNFMLQSPFELLSEKREAIELQQDYVGALASYWKARTALELALGKPLPVTAAPQPQEKPEDKPEPQTNQHNSHQHNSHQQDSHQHHQHHQGHQHD